MQYLCCPRLRCANKAAFKNANGSLGNASGCLLAIARRDALAPLAHFSTLSPYYFCYRCSGLMLVGGDFLGIFRFGLFPFIVILSACSAIKIEKAAVRGRIGS
jgi:hypothetical protein